MSEFNSEITSDDKLWAALGYPIPLVAIIVLFMDEKKARPFIKFHAVQSLAANVVFFVISVILSTVTLGFGGLCVPLIWFVFLYWAYKSYQGEYFEIPMVTNFIKKQNWV
jgi:uncharacterized membrane protein